MKRTKTDVTHVTDETDEADATHVTTVCGSAEGRPTRCGAVAIRTGRDARGSGCRGLSEAPRETHSRISSHDLAIICIHAITVDCLAYT